MKCAPATGIVAVTEPVPRFMATTAPGDCPLMEAPGTAANPTLSFPMNMLSVEPGRVMTDTDEVPPGAVAMASVVLSTTVTVLLEALKTIVNFRSEETAMSPGRTLKPSKLMKELESLSLDASTIFRTGELRPPPGRRALETKARNLSPLMVCLLELLPQETTATLAAMRTATLVKAFFKPGTPKSMKDRDLDARNGIITERIPGVVEIRVSGSVLI